ncbi:hypothetical protein MGYG_08418 [Nannizzia gypsea CBS 118893]|uniref:Uncharacterized protein n=1 Tax=Arthroderma gypseum (strain ATCC MYA-4604 / CBS 118893) TaxID=535722 RepID=E4V5N1_ARTGP|nr:hypothetical protein MGYG_08418 [Nannizzia gypsea CBS 118893]EFR05406.1 hypothetical protein MGYG_08418 [Nannizzia gypsea CBS 118893]
MEPKIDFPITPSPVSIDSFSELTEASLDRVEELGRKSEERLKDYVPLDGGDNVVRLLQTFINYLPKEGSVILMDDIRTLQEDDKLRQLGGHLTDAILKPIVSSGGKTPAIAQSPCVETRDEVDSLMVALYASPASVQSKVKIDCLKRDGFRRQVTGYWDLLSAQKNLYRPETDDPCFAKTGEKTFCRLLWDTSTMIRAPK